MRAAPAGTVSCRESSPRSWAGVPTAKWIGQLRHAAGELAVDLDLPSALHSSPGWEATWLPISSQGLNTEARGQLRALDETARPHQEVQLSRLRDEGSSLPF